MEVGSAERLARRARGERRRRYRGGCCGARDRGQAQRAVPSARRPPGAADAPGPGGQAKGAPLRARELRPRCAIPGAAGETPGCPAGRPTGGAPPRCASAPGCAFLCGDLGIASWLALIEDGPQAVFDAATLARQGLPRGRHPLETVLAPSPFRIVDGGVRTGAELCKRHGGNGGFVAPRMVQSGVGTRCRARDRNSLEPLCRYIARPAVSNERLSVNDRGQVVYRLEHPFGDGATHHAFMFAGSKSRHLRPRFVCSRTDIEPDDDHTDTPATMAIDALFFLSSGTSAPRPMTPCGCARRSENDGEERGDELETGPAPPDWKRVTSPDERQLHHRGVGSRLEDGDVLHRQGDGHGFHSHERERGVREGVAGRGSRPGADDEAVDEAEEMVARLGGAIRGIAREAGREVAELGGAAAFRASGSSPATRWSPDAT